MEELEHELSGGSWLGESGGALRTRTVARSESWFEDSEAGGAADVFLEHLHHTAEAAHAKHELGGG